MEGIVTLNFNIDGITPDTTTAAVTQRRMAPLNFFKSILYRAELDI